VSYRAVVFDLGGVVLGSPIHAIHRYEDELGFEKNAINRVVAATAPHGAWSRLERGELGMDAFFPAFEEECRRAGFEICARSLFERMAAESLPRPAMLAAIRRLREVGLRVGALTNNWPSSAGEDSSRAPDGGGELASLFDVFIESRVEGLRKPDPRIYRLACERLRVSPPEAVFLDDIGANLKPARALGFTTIKVDDPEAALAELWAVLGLRAPAASGNARGE
jgi:putative hydrolase of the HAD superfamily